MKDERYIINLTKNLLKNLLFLLFLLKLTILKNGLQFYITNNIKKSTIFYYLYMSPLFLQNLSILHYKKIFKLY